MFGSDEKDSKDSTKTFVSSPHQLKGTPIVDTLEEKNLRGTQAKLCWVNLPILHFVDTHYYGQIHSKMKLLTLMKFGLLCHSRLRFFTMKEKLLKQRKKTKLPMIHMN
jgi:hypothetical protein